MANVIITFNNLQGDSYIKFPAFEEKLQDAEQTA